MTENKDKKPGEPSRADDPSASKRPHATLDLKAVEVKGDGASKGASIEGAASRPGAGAKDTGASAAAGNDTTKDHGRSSSAPSSAPASAPARETGAKPGTPPPRSSVPPRKPSMLGRIASHTVAGVAGGALALFGGDWLLQQAGLPAPGAQISQTVASVEERLARVEAAQKDQPSASVAGDLAATGERLAALERLTVEISDIRAAQSQLAGAQTENAEKLAALSADTRDDERLKALEDQLATLANAAGTSQGGSPIADLAAITAKIAAIEQSTKAEITSLSRGLPADLDSRLTAMASAGENAQTSLERVGRDLDQTKSDIAHTLQQLETLKADRERLERAVQAAREETGRAASELADLKGAIDQQARTFVKPSDIDAAVSPVAGQISRIEGSLEDVLKKEQERQSNAERILLSLELGALKRAVDQGAGFAAELETVRAISGGALNLDALDRFKTQGVPTLAALQSSGRAALRAAVDNVRIDAVDGVWDRLLAGAQSVVRVRRIDHDASDDGLDAVASRIEKALAEGRLADVIADLDKLPPAVAPSLQTWREQIVARHAVDEAIAATEQDLKAALRPAVTPTDQNP